jgi:hypothetical protein
VEPMTGIEPAYSAWEAISRVERAFYSGWSEALPANSNSGYTCGRPVALRRAAPKLDRTIHVAAPDHRNDSNGACGLLWSNTDVLPA